MNVVDSYILIDFIFNYMASFSKINVIALYSLWFDHSDLSDILRIVAKVDSTAELNQSKKND